MTSVLSENGSSNEVAGCGGRLMQKTESFMKRHSHKYSNRPSSTNSNYTSAPLPSEKTPGIMPQKTYIFWLLILIIFFMAAVNFTVLVIMISVLRIGEGMESIEMLSNEEIIKLYGNTDFDQLLYENGALKGFQDLPLHITSNEGQVLMALKKYGDIIPTNKVKISSNEVHFSDVESFEVIDPETRNSIFSTGYKHFKIPKGLSNLNVKKLRVNRLISSHNSNLTIKSDSRTSLHGNEGVKIRGKEITHFADGDIYLRSVNGSIYLLSGNITIDIKRIPTVPTREIGQHPPTPQYKLCVCMPQGILFKVNIVNGIPSKETCGRVDLSGDNHPCVTGQ